MYKFEKIILVNEKKYTFLEMTEEKEKKKVGRFHTSFNFFLIILFEQKCINIRENI